MSPPQQVKLVLDEELYNQLFKFVFIRNPWDLHVSLYNYFRKKVLLEKGKRLVK